MLSTVRTGADYQVLPGGKTFQFNPCCTSMSTLEVRSSLLRINDVTRMFRAG